MYMADENKNIIRYDQDYYKMLQDENYKNLLDSEIQLNNARERSLRQTNANLAGYGLASAGYGQTARSGIENQYLSALGSASDAYTRQTEQNIKDATEYTTAKYNNFILELQENDMSTDEKQREVLKNYGLINEDGTINREEFERQFGQDEGTWGSFQNRLNQLKEQGAAESGAVNLEDENYKKNVEATKDEMNWLTSNEGQQFSKNFRDGDVIKLSGNTDDTNQVYYKYQNGQMVPITKADYDKASGEQKYWIRSHKNNTNMIVDWNGKTIYDMSNNNAKNATKGLGWATIGLGAPALFAAGITALANSKRHKEIYGNYNDYMNYYNNLG